MGGTPSSVIGPTKLGTNMPTETTLIQALVAAQAEMPNPPLDGFNPHFKSKFSTLLAVRDTVIPILNKHGIFVSQMFDGDVLVTSLFHATGRIDSRAPIPNVPDVQKWAAAVTYIRRIALLSICGVVGDPDADAEDVVRASIADRSGRPDTSAVASEPVRKYAKAFRDGLVDRNDEAVLRVHDDLNAEPETYTAVTDALEPKEKDAIREAIVRARQTRAAVRKAF
jgi:hypothetical protein